MRLFSLSISILVLINILSACSRQKSPDTQKAEQQVANVTNDDWAENFSLDDLSKAAEICTIDPDIFGCYKIGSHLKDVAISFASCADDQRSSLCQAVVHKIGTHLVYKSLPSATAITLPRTPFYLFLPTDLLDAQSQQFNYRDEAWSWFWARWRWSIIFAIILSIVTYLLWQYWEREAQNKIANEAEQRRQKQIETDKEEAERRQFEHEQKMKSEKERIARQVKFDAQLRQAAADQAARAAHERAVWLANEKANIEDILSVALKGITTPKSERMKHGTSSK